MYLIPMICLGTTWEKPPLGASLIYYPSQPLRPVHDTVKVAELISEANKIIETNPKKALVLADKGYKLSNKINFGGGTAGALEIKGNIYSYLRDYKKALHYFDKSLGMYRSMGKNINAVDVQNNIGIVYSKQGSYYKALQYFIKTLEDAREIDDKYGMCSSYNNMGIIYSAQGNYQEALNNYLKAVNLQQKLQGNQILNFGI